MTGFRRAGNVVFVLCVLAAAGCGGSGASAPRVASSTDPHAAARIAVQTALSLAADVVFANDDVSIRPPDSQAGCSGNAEFSGNTNEVFYDTGCTHLWRKTVWTSLGAQASAQSTWYEQNGSIAGYAAVASFGNSNCGDCGYGNLTASVSQAQAGPTVLGLQSFCRFVLASGACNGTIEANDQPLGQSLGTSFSSGWDSSASAGSPATEWAQTLTGAFGAFSGSESGSAWAQQWSLTGSGSQGTSFAGSLSPPGGFLGTPFSLTLADSTAGTSISETVHADATVSGTVSSAAGATLVTFGVDANGSGSAAYTDGTAEPIALYVIR